MSTKELGILGEEIAANYLKEKGYKILDRNYVPKWIKRGKKEIDIVATKKNILVFVEVKSGELSKDFYPEDKVNFEKQKNLIFAAKNYLEEKKIKPDTKWQIDVISVEFDSDFKNPKIRHIENAIPDIDTLP